MSNSAEVNPGDDILASAYNNLRKDVIDPTLGHNHEGVEGKILGAGALATNSVETLKIKDGNVTAVKLASNAVETAKIKDLNVTTGKIGDLDVTAAKIASNAITTIKILDGAVTLDKINLATGSYSEDIPGGSAGALFSPSYYAHQLRFKGEDADIEVKPFLLYPVTTSYVTLKYQMQNSATIIAKMAYSIWYYHSNSKQAIWGIWDKEAKKLICVLVEEDDGEQKLFPELKENQVLVKFKNPEKFLDSSDKEKIKEKTMAGYILEYANVEESDIEEAREK